jgi:hypothetical protein
MWLTIAGFSRLFRERLLRNTLLLLSKRSKA